MNNPARLLLAVVTLSTLTGCVTSLSERAKLLAATQQCGGADSIAENPELMKSYSHCVAVQLDAMHKQEAAYERQQSDVVVGLSKALALASR